MKKQFLYVLMFIVIILAISYSGYGCTTRRDNMTLTELINNQYGINYLNISGITKQPVKKWGQILPPPFLNDGNTKDHAIAVDGKVYVSSTGGYFAFDIKTGNVMWRNKNPKVGLSVHSLKYYKGKLYTVVYSSGKIETEPYLRLVCLNAKDGKMLWNSPVLGIMPNDISNNMIFLNGRLYIGGYIDGKNAGIYCFNSSNGDVIYKYIIKDFDPFFDSLVSDGKYIYGLTSVVRNYTTTEIDLFCFDTKRKTIKWKFPAGDKDMYNFRWTSLGITDSAFIVEYLSLPTDNITPGEITVIKAFDLKSHKLLWEKRTCCIDDNDKIGFHLKSNPSLRFLHTQMPDFSSNGKLVFTTLGDGSLIAIDIKSGNIIWNYFTGKGSPDDKEKNLVWFGDMHTFCTKNVLYASVNLPDESNGFKGWSKGYIYAFSPSNGRILWKLPLNNTVNPDIRMFPIENGLILRYGNTRCATKPVSIEEKLELLK